jgi:hypothetical protein
MLKRSHFRLWHHTTPQAEDASVILQARSSLLLRKPEVGKYSEAASQID